MPSDLQYTTTLYTPPKKQGVYQSQGYKTNSRKRFYCITAVSRPNLRDLFEQTSNVRRRLTETGRTNGLRSHHIEIFTSPATWADLYAAKVRNIFESAK